MDRPGNLRVVVVTLVTMAGRFRDRCSYHGCLLKPIISSEGRSRAPQKEMR